VRNTSSLLPAVFLWLPLVAIAAHLFEEFVWPGGFPEWYRQYPPGRTAKVATRFLVIVNIVFVALALIPPLFGATTKGYAYWLVVAAIAGAHGIFHFVATSPSVAKRSVAHRRIQSRSRSTTMYSVAAI
jgi:hypothetical protein